MGKRGYGLFTHPLQYLPPIYFPSFSRMRLLEEQQTFPTCAPVFALTTYAFLMCLYISFFSFPQCAVHGSPHGFLAWFLGNLDCSHPALLTISPVEKSISVVPIVTPIYSFRCRRQALYWAGLSIIKTDLEILTLA